MSRLAARLAALLLLALHTPVHARPLLVAVASTLDNSGFAEHLTSSFAKDGCTINSLAASSAQAISLLKSGDVNAAITHARDLEERYVKDNELRKRIEFAANEFVLVGPSSDPAGVRALDLGQGFAAIASAKARFLSRGDQSGTHAMETRIWHEALAGVPATGPWYLSGGNHMAATLIQADQSDAYTLTDSATFAQLRMRGVQLEMLAKDNPPRRNVYSLLLSENPHPCAVKLGQWLQSNQGRQVIDSYKVADQQVLTSLP